MLGIEIKELYDYFYSFYLSIFGTFFIISLGSGYSLIYVQLSQRAFISFPTFLLIFLFVIQPSYHQLHPQFILNPYFPLTSLYHSLPFG